MDRRNLAVFAIALIAVAVTTTASAQDGLIVGNPSSCISVPQGASSVTVPIYVRDVAGTPLGMDKLPGSKIQAISLQIVPSPASSILKDGSGNMLIVAAQAGVTSGKTAAFFSNPRTPTSASVIMQFDETSSALSFTQPPTSQGDLVANLTVSLDPSAAAGSTISLTVSTNVAVTQLSNFSGTVAEASGGDLAITNGCLQLASAGSVRGDFNLDGKTDIALRNYTTGQNALWILNGTSLQSIVDLPALPNTNYRIEGTADFSGDGKCDIALRNQSTGQDALWVMDGTTLQTIVDLPALQNSNYHFEGTSDFNNNGTPDIILRNYSTGQNALWLMSGTSLVSIVDLPALPNTDYRIESASDFNNDGKPDTVLRNYSTGQNALWLMNGTSLQTIVDLPALPNTNYRIDGVGDFNNDGKPDIILRNYITGQNAVWIMNGTSLQTIVDLPALPNVNYEINGPR